MTMSKKHIRMIRSAIREYLSEWMSTKSVEAGRNFRAWLSIMAYSAPREVNGARL